MHGGEEGNSCIEALLRNAPHKVLESALVLRSKRIDELLPRCGDAQEERSAIAQVGTVEEEPYGDESVSQDGGGRSGGTDTVCDASGCRSECLSHDKEDHQGPF